MVGVRGMVAYQICVINSGIVREGSVHGFNKNLAPMIVFMEGYFVINSPLHESLFSGPSREQAYGP